MLAYPYLKSLHIVGFVAWFAGLFYWLRIVVYLAEGMRREEPARGVLVDQFTRMERRVYSIIVVPGAVITWAGGLSMIALNPVLLEGNWLRMKLVLLVGLLAFQAFAKTRIRALQARSDAAPVPGDERLRLLNEVPTVFLLTIVLLAVLRDGLEASVAFGILIVFVVLLATGVRWYRRYRERHPEH